MNAVIHSASLAVTAAAVTSMAATLVATRHLTTALTVFLDLLLAASLLRLALPADPSQLLAVVALLVLKRLASSGLRRAHGAAGRQDVRIRRPGGRRPAST